MTKTGKKIGVIRENSKIHVDGMEVDISEGSKLRGFRHHRFNLNLLNISYFVL